MVYDDRVEIMSPGGPYGNQTIEKMTSGWSSLRNPSLAKMFKYLHLIDNWGTGLQRSIEMCESLGIKVEVFNDGIGIRVNIYRPSYKPEIKPDIKDKQISNELYALLTEQEKLIVDYLQKYGFIRRSTVEDILKIGNTRAKEIISNLVEKNIIIVDGKGPSTNYKLK